MRYRVPGTWYEAVQRAYLAWLRDPFSVFTRERRGMVGLSLLSRVGVVPLVHAPHTTAVASIRSAYSASDRLSHRTAANDRNPPTRAHS